MRFERLVIEASENTFSLDFNPKLTVIAGVGDLEREGLINELVGSLGSSRPGVHAEIVADTGNRFAIFRPHGGRARVIDIDAQADVSDRFAAADGRVDLLGHAELNVKDTKRAMRVTSADLMMNSQHDANIHRLACIEDETLWDAAYRVTSAETELEQKAFEAGSTPEDAEVVARIEEHHALFEARQAVADRWRRISYYSAATAAVAALPAALLVTGYLSLALVAAASLAGLLSMLQNRRMGQALTQEEEALADAGAASYLGFHLQRVDGLLESGKARAAMMQARADYRDALDQWTSLVGDISVEWAASHRIEVAATKKQLHSVQAFTSFRLAEQASDGTSIYSHPLLNRINGVRGIGPAGESLPLIIDEAFAKMEDGASASLLELLVTASEEQQIIILTQEAELTSWARVEAMTGDLTLIEPARDAAQASAGATALVTDVRNAVA